MAIYCTSCGIQNPDNATFCSKCGVAMPQPATAPGAPLTPASPANPTAAPVINHNAAAAISYLTFIAAIIMLAIEPYRSDRFVRFHAWQCIWLSVVYFAIRFALFWVPGFGLAHFALREIVGLIFFVGWLIAIVHAAQGKIFKLPVVGDMAEAQVGKL